MRPICDDYWMDLEAAEFCKMKGYHRGRRASTTTKEEFARTHLNCFDFFSSEKTKLVASKVGILCLLTCNECNECVNHMSGYFTLSKEGS